jgi:hypothetical protein
LSRRRLPHDASSVSDVESEFHRPTRAHPDAVPSPRRLQANLGPRRQHDRPTSEPQPATEGSRAAWRWQKLLDVGVYTSISEIAEAEDIGKPYVREILRLSLLALDIIEAILEGRTD